MERNRTNFSPRDMRHISFLDQEEIDFWTSRFRTSEHDLRNAVQAVGFSAQKVSERIELERLAKTSTSH